jgi:hypothetical protein
LAADRAAFMRSSFESGAFNRSANHPLADNKALASGNHYCRQEVSGKIIRDSLNTSQW